MKEKFILCLVALIVLSPLIVSTYVAYDNYKITKERVLLNQKFRTQIQEFQVVIDGMKGR